MLDNENKQNGNQNAATNSSSQDSARTSGSPLPSISLPKGGGAIRDIGEKFAVNAATGTGSLTIPLPISPGRSGFGPTLSLSYDSGAGNGPFGFGWHIALPEITRKTDKGLPRYLDDDESDIFILSGVEDLVPVLDETGQSRVRTTRTLHGTKYQITWYRPRIEGLFSRIERWTAVDGGSSHWRTITRDNVTTLYGLDSLYSLDSTSCITDPTDATKIFSYLPCRTFDDNGNLIVYEYISEDSRNVDTTVAHETNRTSATRAVQRYLKYIYYGNMHPYTPDWSETGDEPPLPTEAEWYFKIVFDYGDHSTAAPAPKPDQAWPVRPDPFSRYRSGFEVRTYRRCARILQFHNFPQEADVGADCLVRSMDFVYSDQQTPTDPSNPIYTFLASITQGGFRRQQSGYQPPASMPPLEFEYSPVRIQPDVLTLEGDAVANMPVGIEGADYRWVDLDGEGLSGMLSDVDGAWTYKRNTSANNLVPQPDGSYAARAQFDPIQYISTLPSRTTLDANQRLMDLSADGRLDVVALSEPDAGYYERTEDLTWAPLERFAALPQLDWTDRNITFVDLTGDGLADILLTEDGLFSLWTSSGEHGFQPPLQVRTPWNEERGPQVVLADGTETIFLADMTGDGLSDLVRVRNGEVAYWPNLGYGRFGPKVTMDNAPRFTDEERYDPHRVHLADIDGSGTADLLYVGDNGVTVCFNQSGNAWAQAQLLAVFPSDDPQSRVDVVDLLGTGTACLTWSSPLPFAASIPLRYVDLMGGQKPHLLTMVRNNLGAETRITYAPSTRFYLADRLAGEPWITRIHFPVQVVERVEIFDWIGRSRLVSRYAYHHGYFDGVEREFRGFGRVEQWDTEEHRDDIAFPEGEATNWDSASWSPPMMTRTWFHTGAFVEAGIVSGQYAKEYWPEAMQLPDSLLPEGLAGDDLREAYRALKGQTLRTEIYAQDDSALKGIPFSWSWFGSWWPSLSHDGSAPEDNPYSVVENNYTVTLLQPSGPNRYASFYTHVREKLSFQYERAANDPRVTHDVSLEVDPFGNELRHVSVGYPRRPGYSPPEPSLSSAFQSMLAYDQTRLHIMGVQNSFTNDLADPTRWPDVHRTPLPSETITAEITTTPPTAPTSPFSFDDLDTLWKAIAQTATIGGSITINDVLTTTINGISISYTVGAADTTLAVLAGHVAAAINATASINGVVSASTSGNVIAIVGTDPSGAGNAFSLACSVSAGATETYTSGGSGDYDVPYEHIPRSDIDGMGSVDVQTRRIVEQTRTLYRSDDLTVLLPVGQFQSGARPGESYKLALTPSLITTVFNTLVTDAMLSEGGYVQLAGDPNWWMPFGRIYYSLPEDVGKPAQELANAQAHGYLPRLYIDPFGAISRIDYDAYDLLGVTATDPVGNVTSAANNYRVLQPAQVTDPNGNRTQVAFDKLGFVVGTAVMGKTGESVGDSLAGFDPDLDLSTILTHLSGPLNDPGAILGSATTRMVYDLAAFSRTRSAPQPDPVVVYTLARETHVSDLAANQTTLYQHTFSYSDGFAREIQRKTQVEPGPVVDEGLTVPARWVGSGWTIFNNKGKPVRKYEPFFSATNAFEFAAQVGVSTNLFYDPPGRVVATLHPDNTWEKVVFDCWRQESWDGNDTVLIADPRTDPGTDPEIRDHFLRLLGSAPGAFVSWYNLRIGGTYGKTPEDQAAEQDAAKKVAVHAATPAVAHFDALGRTCLSISDNGGGKRYPTRTVLDVEGKPLAVFDARGRRVMEYCLRVPQSGGDFQYIAGTDLAGNPLYHNEMDAGARRSLVNVSQKPIRTWDARGHAFRILYDLLQRPTHRYVSTNGAAGVLLERLIYGEGQAIANRCGRLFRHYDTAGVAINNLYDFKGNLVSSTRQLAIEYHQSTGWSPLANLTDPAALDAAAAPLLVAADSFTSTTIYDALNRPIQVVTPHNANMHPDVLRPLYNEASLLNQVDVWLQQAAMPGGLLDPTKADLHAVTAIDYNARRQRTQIALGNGTTTAYGYDHATFRLTQLTTTRPSSFASDQQVVQDLSYYYDPVGNITRIRDTADTQDVIYFRNQRVEPSTDYTYDPTYRLISATGREHLGQTNSTLNAPQQVTNDDSFRTTLPQPGDGNAMGTYTETYTYDPVGNLLMVLHQVSSGSWTRPYSYVEPSQITPTEISNRLTATGMPGDPAIGPYTRTYSYDTHGNMIKMPHLPSLTWDEQDRLRSTTPQFVNTGTPEMTYYVYDASWQRVRKVTERQAAQGQTPTRMKERIYLGNFEIYREYGGDGATVTLEWETLHAMDDKQRIALVEMRTQGNDNSPAQLTRYQFSNHLGTACLELDNQAQIISYEEYYPYGSTSYQAVRSQTETKKRYRYTGKERDEENGLYYHGARYYACWLGRWTACDPKGMRDSVNLYLYCKANPLTFYDPSGNQREAGPLLQEYLTWQMYYGKGTDDRGALQEFTKWYERRYQATPDIDQLAKSFSWKRTTDQQPVISADDPQRKRISQKEFESQVNAIWRTGEAIRSSALAGVTFGVRNMIYGESAIEAHGRVAAAETLGAIAGGLGGIVKARQNAAMAFESSVPPAAPIGGLPPPPSEPPAPPDELPPPAPSELKQPTEATGFKGTRGAPLENAPYQGTRNADAILGGRRFVGHAIDQMQNRGIMPSVVENTIQKGVPSPDPIPGRTRFYDPINKVTVITEGEDIITVMHGRR